MNLKSENPDAELANQLAIFVRVDDWLRGHGQTEAADLVLTLKDRYLKETGEQAMEAVAALMTLVELTGGASPEDIQTVRDQAATEVARKLAAADAAAYGHRYAEHAEQRNGEG